MTFYIVQLAKPVNLFWSGKSWVKTKPARVEFYDPIKAAGVARELAATSEHPVSIIDGFETAVLTVPGGRDPSVVRKLP